MSVCSRSLQIYPLLDVPVLRLAGIAHLVLSCCMQDYFCEQMVYRQEVDAATSPTFAPTEFTVQGLREQIFVNVIALCSLPSAGQHKLPVLPHWRGSTEGDVRDHPDIFRV